MLLLQTFLSRTVVTLQAISEKVAGQILIDQLILYITCQEILGWFSFGWHSCHRSYYMVELLLVF